MTGRQFREVMLALLVFYAIVGAACMIVAVFSGGLPWLYAGLSVARVLAVPMCMSAAAVCAVFFLQ